MSFEKLCKVRHYLQYYQLLDKIFHFFIEFQACLGLFGWLYRLFLTSPTTHVAMSSSTIGEIV